MSLVWFASHVTLDKSLPHYKSACPCLHLYQGKLMPSSLFIMLLTSGALKNVTDLLPYPTYYFVGLMLKSAV